jgi:hypothetical protein
VVSLPTVIVPSALMLAGTFAARDWSAATDEGALAPEEPPAAEPPDELLPEEPLPHPVTTRAALASAATAAAERRVRVRVCTVVSLSSTDGDRTILPC